MTKYALTLICAAMMVATTQAADRGQDTSTTRIVDVSLVVPTANSMEHLKDHFADEETRESLRDLLAIHGEKSSARMRELLLRALASQGKQGITIKELIAGIDSPDSIYRTDPLAKEIRYYFDGVEEYTSWYSWNRTPVWETRRATNEEALAIVQVIQLREARSPRREGQAAPIPDLDAHPDVEEVTRARPQQIVRK